MAGRPPSERSRYRLAAFMTGAGVMHFVAPRFYESSVPSWVGHETAVVRWSGIAEMASGALVAIPRTRRLGAWCAVVTLVGVYPANIQMALDAGVPRRDPRAWAVWLRLPLQFPMIRWALKHTA